MVPPVRIELTASPLPRVRSTPELRRHPKGGAQCHWRAKCQLHVYRIGDITIIWKRMVNPRPSREEERRARQAEALRANLQRRKQQVREREDANKRDGGPAGSGPVSRK